MGASDRRLGGKVYGVVSVCSDKPSLSAQDHATNRITLTLSDRKIVL